MGDAKENQETHTFFKQFNKRNRTDLEEDSAASEGNLGVQPGNTNSDKPGRVTILPRPTSPTKQGPSITLDVSSSSTMETPSLDNLQSASVETVVRKETVVRNHGYNQREQESLAFRLDKLNDKKCRYVSHESFLKKCLDNSLIPNGLKVYVEPSIGNRCDEFLEKWHNRMEEFSKVLTTDVIEFCEKEIKQTTNEIEETSKTLKELMTTPEYTEVTLKYFSRKI